MGLFDSLSGAANKELEELRKEVATLKSRAAKAEAERDEIQRKNLQLIDKTHAFLERLKLLVGTLESEHVLLRTWDLIDMALSLKKAAIYAWTEQGWIAEMAVGFGKDGEAPVIPLDEESVPTFAAGEGVIISLAHLRKQDDLAYLERRGIVPDVKIACPVRVEGEIRKLILVCAYGGNVFAGEDDLDILNMVATILGLVTTNTRILDRQKTVLAEQAQIIEAKQAEVQEKEKIIEESKAVIEETKAVIEEKDLVLEETELEIEEKQRALAKAKADLFQKERMIEEQQEVVNHLSVIVDSQKDAVVEASKLLEEHRTAVDEKERVIGQQKAALSRQGVRMERLRGIFTRMVAPEIISFIERNPDGIVLGGVRQCVAVLFTDIRGFTQMSEKNPPELVINLLNRFFSKLTEIVIRHHGTLDKFMGDAAMVLFGTPVALDAPVQKAIQAAFEIQTMVVESSAEWEKCGFPGFSVGIGINFQDVVVGNVGSEKLSSFTAIGDGVNLAYRLCGIAKGGEIILSQPCIKHLTPGAQSVEPRHGVQIKGKSQPMTVFSIARTAADLKAGPCPKCTAPLLEGARFCGKCGFRRG